MAVPVYVGFDLKRLNVNIGFQTAFALASGGKVKVPWISMGQTDLVTFEFKNLNITDFDFGPRVGLVYQLSNKFSIEANGYYGLINIAKKGPHTFGGVKEKIQQIMLGLRYNFVSPAGQKTKPGAE